MNVNKFDAKMGFWCTKKEREVIQRAASILGVSASCFIRSAALAQSLPMEDCRKVVIEKCKSAENVKNSLV